MNLDPATWLHHFVLPLVAGGDVRVQSAVGAGELELMLAMPPDGDPAVGRIAEARQAVMAELILDPPPPALDEPALRLAAAMQNLLFLVHPASGGTLVRKKRLSKVAQYARELADLPEAATAYELAARHSIVHHLFDLGRDDVRVTFWAGRREFKGAEPPARLLKWATVRRVREERWRASIVAETATDPEQRGIVEALLAASPFTELLDPLRLDPPLDLATHARWLRDPDVARAVADRWLALGPSQMGAQVTAALLRLHDRPRQPADARLATQFFCHLHLLTLLAHARRSASDHLQELQAQVQAQSTLKDFYGLFTAAQRVGLGRPADVKLDRRLEESVNGYSAACGAVCGEPRVLELSALLMRSVQATLAVPDSVRG